MEWIIFSMKFGGTVRRGSVCILDRWVTNVHNSLEHLDIEEVGLGKASKKFMVWLSQNSQLKSLNVSHNQLTGMNYFG